MLAPDVWVASLEELDPELLLRRGVQGVVLDIDNTLLAWNQASADEVTRARVARLKQAGLAVVLLSNATSRRRQAVARELGVPCCPGPKPLRRAFLRAARTVGLPPHRLAVVGDQLWTDVLGARRAGMVAVLVNPISRREHWLTRLGRLLERLALQGLVRCGKLPRQLWEARYGSRG
ncbi:MAG TPA: YqeG family HAD IIIA-type phosphatase [Limnochordales bacterium]